MRYLWSVSLLVFSLLGNILYIFQDIGFFHSQFSHLGSYERQESVMDEAKVLMEYRYNDDDLIVSDVYTQAEKEHLYDVKKILFVVRYMLLAAGFWLLVFSAWLRWRGFDISRFLPEAGKLQHSLRMTVVGFVLLGVGLFVVSWFAWDWLFDSFHRLFFVDNRTFSSDSFLIQSYPWEFFRNAMVVVIVRTFGMLLATSLLLLVVDWLTKQKKPRRA